ncbi:MAG: MBL fold metallo-hydrolase [Burkholderiales bacterium]|nr:MBL fold metallo-hydrolase [Burkholderiales bacterium]
MITNTQSGTNIHEIARGIYRINTPVDTPGGPFNFNQYLIVDDAPLLFHTGPRGMFPLVREAVARVMPVERLRYVAYSHFEPDESGALNQWLAAAPHAEALSSSIGAMVGASDVADRPVRGLADGEIVALGQHSVRWFDTPHLPHGWDSGLMMESSTRTFLCGDLFTQGGPGAIPLTEADILEPSEAFRGVMDYYSHSPDTGAMLERLAAERPTTLACMHGSAWRGDGAALLRALAARLAANRQRRTDEAAALAA